MTSTRRCQRFRVKPNFPMRVSVAQSRSGRYKLETLSEGGFGFFAPAREANLTKYPTVHVSFSLGQKTINVKCRVQYCKFLPKFGQNLIGFQFEEFDERSEWLLKTIIEAAVAKGDLVDASMNIVAAAQSSAKS